MKEHEDAVLRYLHEDGVPEENFVKMKASFEESCSYFDGQPAWVFWSDFESKKYTIGPIFYIVRNDVKKMVILSAFEAITIDL